MGYVESFLFKLHDIIWGVPLLALLLGTGVYLTIILRGLQFRYLGYALKQAFVRGYKGEGKEGDISPFQALMTSLAGAIGTGNIVGIATGIMIGGVGALFWMWVMTLFSMATKYAESLLAVKYREVDARGEMIGGPMQYIERGIGLKWLAAIFAILGTLAAIGTGNLVQVNAIAHAIFETWAIDPWISGVIVAILIGIVVLGGIKSIAIVSEIIVPFMALFYIIGGLAVIGINYEKIPGAFVQIFQAAFSGQAAAGGFAGASIMMAIQMGFARSVFSNEAGLGLSTIAAAAAKTDSPGRQAMITMTGALLSTLVVCTITGLVLVVSGVIGTQNASGEAINGAALAMRAFDGIPFGNYVVSIGLILFAFTTVIAWEYYGEKCCEYLFGVRSVIVYRLLFTLLVIPGSVLKLDVVWSIADSMNGIMAIPNLIALLLLSKDIRSETKIFLEKVKEEETAAVSN